ncbi:TetR/AcrR family transcriptional regulator [Caulobacter soli]|uniref:TetR/AcrR family transcriptional regulator n=1 Tax=Caulobacter soli TaxID=2708539 RepID=UPI0013EA5274|nr:TetR/AcrR family transcriptional regulator [Caulobacter soli]
MIVAAAAFLRAEPVASFTLDAVAKAAGLTRLTLYNQFGSRRALLKAVFDRLALEGGLKDLPQAVISGPPREALRTIIGVFCDFWGGDPAVSRLNEAIALDPDLDRELAARNELRRSMLDAVIGRMDLSGAPHGVRAQTVDLLFAMTSYTFYRQLKNGPAGADPKRLISETAEAEVERMLAARAG